jgi:hypothetical protein
MEVFYIMVTVVLLNRSRVTVKPEPQSDAAPALTVHALTLHLLMVFELRKNDAAPQHLVRELKNITCSCHSNIIFKGTVSRDF